MKSISGNSIEIGRKSLDALWLRSRVISDNIANVDTPGYKSRAVEFERLFERALEDSAVSGADAEEVLAALRPEVLENGDVSLREDGNSVDIDAENIELVRTLIQYQTMSAAVSGEFSRLKYAVSGGSNG